MENKANTQETLQDLPLSSVQQMGMQQYQLTREDVQTINFGEDTLRGMNSLLQDGRVYTTQEAFATLRGLNAMQIQGITEYEMTREQVLDTAFGGHTLAGIDKLVKRNRAENSAQAATMLTGLNPYQIEGVVAFELDPREVRTQNYGEHTNDAINRLRGFRRVRNFHRALQLVSGLNADQTRGMVDYRLTREQVLAPNFGRHTLTGIRELLDDRRVTSHREGFLMLRELDPNQISGITFYGLRRNQVLEPNFGQHTLRGIMALRLNSTENLTFLEAHQQVRFLNRAQTEGVTRFGLTREQVTNPFFTGHILNTMNALQQMNPNASGTNIFEYAMEMPEYQIRAISAFNFTPAQLGIAPEEGSFVQLESSDQEIISGSTVEAVAHLMEENMSRDDALEAASELNIFQKIGMLEMGLTLEQVQSPMFENAENALNALMQELNGLDNEFELPLLNEDRERAREIMARLILEDAVVRSNSQTTETQSEDVLSESQSGLLEPEGHRLDENDIDEFLKYALPRDFLGIFDGLRPAIEHQKQKSSPEISEENEAIEQEMLQATVAMSGVASRPQNEDIETFEQTEAAFNLSAFTIPSSPVSSVAAARRRSDSLESEDERKPAAKRSGEDRKPSPKPKNKSYKR